jgi:hypothetical protein
MMTLITLSLKAENVIKGYYLLWCWCHDECEFAFVIRGDEMGLITNCPITNCIVSKLQHFDISIGDINFYRKLQSSVR